MSYVRCGIGVCKTDSDVVVWTVPLCEAHWRQCCREEPGGSLPWLRRKARRDIVATLPNVEPSPPRKKRGRRT